MGINFPALVRQRAENVNVPRAVRGRARTVKSAPGRRTPLWWTTRSACGPRSISVHDRAVPEASKVRHSVFSPRSSITLVAATSALTRRCNRRNRRDRITRPGPSAHEQARHACPSERTRPLVATPRVAERDEDVDDSSNCSREVSEFGPADFPSAPFPRTVDLSSARGGGTF